VDTPRTFSSQVYENKFWGDILPFGWPRQVISQEYFVATVARAGTRAPASESPMAGVPVKLSRSGNSSPLLSNS